MYDLDQQSNSFKFNHNMSYNFQDHPQCPTSRCQFSIKAFSLSLDTILEYHIRLSITINKQSLIIKISILTTKGHT